MSSLSEYSRAQSFIILSRNAIFSSARSSALRQIGQLPSSPPKVLCRVVVRLHSKGLH